MGVRVGTAGLRSSHRIVFETPAMTAISVKVISLPQSVERRASIVSSLDSFPLAWSFFDGLSGDASFGLDYREAMASKYYGRPLSFNEIGCFKSHYTVMHDFGHDGSADWLLVFEDDLIVDPRFDFVEM